MIEFLTQVTVAQLVETIGQMSLGRLLAILIVWFVLTWFIDLALTPDYDEPCECDQCRAAREKNNGGGGADNGNG